MDKGLFAICGCQHAASHLVAHG